MDMHSYQAGLLVGMVDGKQDVTFASAVQANASIPAWDGEGDAPITRLSPDALTFTDLRGRSFARGQIKIQTVTLQISPVTASNQYKIRYVYVNSGVGEFTDAEAKDQVASANEMVPASDTVCCLDDYLTGVDVQPYGPVLAGVTCTLVWRGTNQA